MTPALKKKSKLKLHENFDGRLAATLARLDHREVLDRFMELLDFGCVKGLAENWGRRTRAKEYQEFPRTKSWQEPREKK
jgi:hypothetical protein